MTLSGLSLCGRHIVSCCAACCAAVHDEWASGREPAPMLGIDVSSSSVKLVELSRNRSGDLVLERCAMEPLERGWITDGNIEKFDE
eukprot:gene17606-36144_t